MEQKSLAALFLLLICTLSPNINAQESAVKSTEHRFGVYVATVSDAAITRLMPGLVGGGWHEYQNGITAGLNYIYRINKRLGIETGLEFATFRFLKHPGSHIPPGESYTRAERLNIIVIPLTARLYFLKYFFFNGGTLLDIDISGESYTEKQNGLGIILGIGFEYDFRCGISAYINPYVRVHSLLFLNERILYSERLLHDGIRMGLTYRF